MENDSRSFQSFVFQVMHLSAGILLIPCSLTCLNIPDVRSQISN